MAEQDGGLRQPMSPRIPLMRSKRASIDEKDGVLCDGRVPFDSRGNVTIRGWIISVELEVHISHDELASHLEEDWG